MKSNKKYDYLIVGSGLMGAAFAHLMRRAGKRCLVVECRSHTGGNIHCERKEGIDVHSYGPHILHTDNADVWDFVNSLAPCNRYTNCPLARYDDQLYNLPFNMNTFHQMWGVNEPAKAMEILDRQRKEAVAALDGRTPGNLEEQALLLVGRDIYERLIKGYTEKQWGRPCTQLPPFIIKRLPVRMVYDNNYFNDRYQGIPTEGYNKLTDALLEGIEVRTDCDFLTQRSLAEQAGKVFYTGPIDAYFDYALGHLQYRTVRFETEVLDMPNYQGNAVVNYTHRDVPYTRIIEHKHFSHFGDAVYQTPRTVISREYSTEWKPGMEPYYPVNDTRNSELLKRYQQMAARSPQVIFAGRLAEYKYYDMAPTIERAMRLAEEELK